MDSVQLLNCFKGGKFVKQMLVVRLEHLLYKELEFSKGTSINSALLRIQCCY
jgi:hypothetical protein